MKLILSFVVLVLFSLVFAGCSQKTSTKQPQENVVATKPKVDKPIVEKDQQAKEEKKNDLEISDIFSNAQKIGIVDVSGGNAKGEAWLAIKGEKTHHRVIAHNLPQLLNGDFYEGWLVKDAAAGDFFSTGAMIMEENSSKFTLNYQTEGDKSDYRLVVITLEPDDGDPAPAAHILEGAFASSVDLTIK